jgi:DNA replication protein DnaC
MTASSERNPHLAIAFGIRACLAGHRVRFQTATEWVARLADPKREGRLEDELAALTPCSRPQPA